MDSGRSKHHFQALARRIRQTREEQRLQKEARALELQALADRLVRLAMWERVLEAGAPCEAGAGLDEEDTCG
jgi:hypothetical protein